MVSLITSPAFYILLLLLAAYVFRRKLRTRKLLITIAVVFMLFFSSRPIYNYVSMKWTEGYSSVIDYGKVYHYGIVLGGYGAWDSERDRPEFGHTVDRLLEGIQLYHKKTIEKLVIACDASNRMYEDSDMPNGNPAGMRAYIECLGVAPADLILENSATTTRSNAQTLLVLLGDSLKKERPLLITSSEHMRRALMTFEQEGIPADGYVTDCIIKERQRFTLIPSLSVMNNWQYLLHEFIGYVYYCF